MRVVPGEGVHAGERLGVRSAALVVGEDQVGAAAVEVDLGAEAVERDRGALHVPARPARAEVGLPRRLALPRHPPQQRVERRALARTVGVAAALAGVGQHRGLVVVGLVAEPTGDRGVEVDVGELRVVDAVGRALREQLADQLGDLPHRLDRADVVPRREHPQRFHVFAEQRRLPHAEHDPVVVVAGGALQQRVVDVGDVLDVVHVVPQIPPDPVDQVERQVGRGVAQVRGVVRGDPADVHGGRRTGRGRSDPPGGGVVQTQRRSTPVQQRDVDRGPGLHGTNLRVGSPPFGCELRLYVPHVAAGTSRTDPPAPVHADLVHPGQGVEVGVVPLPTTGPTGVHGVSGGCGGSRPPPRRRGRPGWARPPGRRSGGRCRP